MWRNLGYFDPKEIRMGNRFSHYEDPHNTNPEVKQVVNFILRFWETRLLLSLGCYHGE